MMWRSISLHYYYYYSAGNCVKEIDTGRQMEGERDKDRSRDRCTDRQAKSGRRGGGGRV